MHKSNKQTDTSFHWGDWVTYTVRLEKAIGSKGKQPCKHTASETHTHSQSFQKKKVAGMG